MAIQFRSTSAVAAAIRANSRMQPTVITATPEEKLALLPSSLGSEERAEGAPLAPPRVSRLNSSDSSASSSSSANRWRSCFSFFGLPEGPPSRIWLADMVICLVLLFTSESSRGLIVTELNDYIVPVGGTKAWLGWTLAVFSIGRLPSSVLFGWWSERRNSKEVLAYSLLITIIGCLLYCFSCLGTSPLLLLTSRLLIGFGTGNFSVVRAYIASVTKKEQRTRWLGLGGAMQFCGFGLMPIVAGWMSTIDLRLGPLPVNAYTALGYLLLQMNMVVIFLVLFLHERELCIAKAHLPVSKTSGGHPILEMWRSQRWLFISLVVCLLLNFLGRGLLALIEVLGPYNFPVVWQDSDSDALSDSANFFTLLGAVGLVFYIGIDYIPKRCFPEFYQLLAGFLSLAAGSYAVAFCGTALPGFVVGTFLLWSVGSPVTQTLTLSIFSKLLDDHPQGIWMGLMGSSGSLGRVLFPIITGFTPDVVSFALAATLSLLVAFVLWVAVHFDFVQLKGK